MLTVMQVKKLRGRVQGREGGLVKIFSALGDSARLQIFELLTTREEICVSDIAKLLDTSVPAASHHLKVLERAGLVRRERKGQMVCYEIRDDDPLVRSVIKTIRNNSIS